MNCPNHLSTRFDGEPKKMLVLINSPGLQLHICTSCWAVLILGKKL